MILFIIVASLIAIISLVFLLLPLWRKTDVTVGANEVKLSIYRDQLNELQQDLSDGKINQSQFDGAVVELKTSLGLSLEPDENLIIKSLNKPIGTSLSIAALVLIIGVGTYVQVGSFSTINAYDQSITRQSLPELIATLEQKLASEPNNPKGWRILGKVYQEINRTQDAVGAFRKANQYQPNDSEVLTQLAYAIALVEEDDFSGEPLLLLNQAIGIDPENQDATYLIGRHFFKQKDYQKAIHIWQTLLPKLDADNRVSIEEDISIAKEKLDNKLNGKSRQIQIKVSINSNIKPDLNAVVFVTVHAKLGPPMPLAAAKLSVRELPKIVTFDETMGMVAGMNISKFDELIVKARISQSGQVALQPEDIVVSTEVMDFKQIINLEIIDAL